MDCLFLGQWPPSYVRVIHAWLYGDTLPKGVVAASGLRRNRLTPPMSQLVVWYTSLLRPGCASSGMVRCPSQHSPKTPLSHVCASQDSSRRSNRHTSSCGAEETRRASWQGGQRKVGVRTRWSNESAEGGSNPFTNISHGGEAWSELCSVALLDRGASACVSSFVTTRPLQCVHVHVYLLQPPDAS